jgi:hypothetical protein
MDAAMAADDAMALAEQIDCEAACTASVWRASRTRI